MATAPHSLPGPEGATFTRGSCSVVIRKPLPAFVYALLSQRFLSLIVVRILKPSEEEEDRGRKRRKVGSALLSLPFGLTFVAPIFPSPAAAPAPPLPPPSLLLPLSSPLPRIPSPPLRLPPPTRRDIILEADMPPQKRARFAAPSHRFKIRESSAAVDSEEFYVHHQDAQDDRAVLRAQQEATYALQAWTHSKDCIRKLRVGMRVLQGEVRDLQQHRRDDDADRLTRHIHHNIAREDARDPEHHDGLADVESSC
ncbi:hypothetical protein Tco_0710068 [Tanacetum coccineum]